jgi:hypothetical protein
MGQSAEILENKGVQFDLFGSNPPLPTKTAFLFIKVRFFVA